MNLQVAEKTDIRTVQTIIDEAKALGLRVVHRPDPIKFNVVTLDDRRVMQAHTSHEVA